MRKKKESVCQEKNVVGLEHNRSQWCAPGASGRLRATDAYAIGCVGLGAARQNRNTVVCLEYIFGIANRHRQCVSPKYKRWFYAMAFMLWCAVGIGSSVKSFTPRVQKITEMRTWLV